MENHWEKITKKIDHRDPNKFFPIINKIFRPRERTDTPNLTVKEEEARLLDWCGINKETLSKIDEVYIIEEELEKINVIGAYYERIHYSRYLNEKTALKNTVDQKVTEFLNKLQEDKNNNITITTFSDDNKGYAPNDSKDFFCTPTKVNNILKRLPNKTSSGIDGIPSI